MSDDRGLLPVTQKDRDAANRIATVALRYLRHALKHDISFNTLIEAIEPEAARHRLAAAPIAAPGEEVERERCARIADAIATRPVQGPEHGVWERSERATAKRIAAAIRHRTRP